MDRRRGPPRSGRGSPRQRRPRPACRYSPRRRHGHHPRAGTRYPRPRGGRLDARPLLRRDGRAGAGRGWDSAHGAGPRRTVGERRAPRRPVTSAYKVTPYETQLIVSAELQPPAQDVLDPGEVGLALSRTRLRFEDGVEVGRVVESETVVRQPRTRVARSSFWAAKEMYATSYHPCVAGACSYGTSSGMKAGYGVVALNLDWYRALKGVRVYIPGYGVGWSSYVTVYFLAPAPLDIPWFLK
ncbi:hypothetical protein FBQ79_13990 [Anaerolineae bacterium AMX1]|nr:hypothetical protein [Anaerolineae bacterium AMX1]